MPLLVGLIDSSTRRSLEVSFPLRSGDEEGRSELTQAELDEMVAKKIQGGGMMDSIANMANSILGAGMSITVFCYFPYF